MYEKQIINNLQDIIAQRSMWWAVQMEQSPDNTALTWEILAEEKEPITAGRLAEELDIKPSSVTQIVKKLEEEGMVRRVKSEADARVTYIELTDAGKQAAQERATFGNSLLKEIFTPLDSEERAQLNDLLNKLNDHMASDAFKDKLSELFINDKKWEKFEKVDRKIQQAREHMMQQADMWQAMQQHRDGFKQMDRRTRHEMQQELHKQWRHRRWGE